ncbi:ATP-binding protein, partial [Candidatus Parvarchaeota archaeon]|nr:ATP-binding protein [Candidatus Parvarchaeota archaeon]
MENLEFKVSAGLKDIIGRELITSDLIAIFELVKNSYDANAKTVKIVFLNTKSSLENARILIIDDGVGMSLKDIREKWLTVGYSYRNIETPKNKHRIFAGAKGIGRFSCDRLGTRLNMYTKTSSDKKINFITVDWDKFEKDPSSEFEKIHVNYQEKIAIDIEGYNKDNLDHGTVLEISNLRSLWTAEYLRKLKSYLQRLVNPSNSNNDFKIYLEAGEYLEEDKESHRKEREFDVINGRVENMLFEKLEIKTIHIYSSIKDGKIYTILYDGDKYIFKLEEDNKKYQDISNIKVNLFYLDINAKSIFKRIMGIHVKDYGSIFLYKNDFRVQRYGNPNNDWLGLDTRKA